MFGREKAFGNGVRGIPPLRNGRAKMGHPLSCWYKGGPALVGSFWWYDGGMKEKTSITLSKDVLKSIDRVAGSSRSRSAFIEAVLRDYLRKQARAQIEARDLELINKSADELSVEVEDVLGYQATE